MAESAEWARAFNGILGRPEWAQPLPSEQRAFSALIVPFTAAALDSFKNHPVRELLSSKAMDDIGQAIGDDLLDLAASTLLLEYEISVASSRSTLSRLAHNEQTTRSSSWYKEWVTRQLDQRMTSVWESYPALSFMMITGLEAWQRSIDRLLTRAGSDLKDLIGTSTDSKNEITGIRFLKSDPHSGQQRVAIVTVSSNDCWVYKPKPARSTVLFESLLTWVEERLDTQLSSNRHVLDRRRYSWERHLSHLECLDRCAVGRYYERAGVMLFLLHLLGATDCHCQNIIAWGEIPVLIDTETLLHHNLANTAGISASDHVRQLLEQSVLRTGALPARTRIGDLRVDVSGLGGRAGQETGLIAQKWKFPGSDEIAFERTNVRTEGERNQPIWNGEPVGPHDFLEEILAGFTACYTLFSSNIEQLAAPESPLMPFCGLDVRHVVRPTAVYGAILGNSLHPARLRNIEARTAYINGALCDGLAVPASVICAERDALIAGDIPLFHANSSGDELYGPTGTLHGLKLVPSYPECISRLHSLSDADLDLQSRLITDALARKDPSFSTSRRRPTRFAGEMGTDEHGIASWFINHAVYGIDETCSWLNSGDLSASSPWLTAPASYDLYDGLAGIAVFLASYYQITGNADARKLAAGALREAITRLRIDNTSHGRLPIGLAGIGGVLFATARCRAILGRDRIPTQFYDVDELINANLENVGQDNDIMSGVPGAVLGLLALHRQGGVGKHLALAERLGRDLIEVNGGGSGVSRLDSEPVLAGFAHGAAGIAYTLRAVAAATGQSEFYGAARRYEIAEDSLYDLATRRWPDRRSSLDSVGEHWCNGAAGILLARADRDAPGEPLCDSTGWGLDSLIASMCELPDMRKDHLCCGSLGQADVLLHVGHRLKRRDLVRMAQAYALQVCERASRRGAFSLSDDPEGRGSRLGLFSGLAGVGYQLLRIKNPRDLPSVLALH